MATQVNDGTTRPVVNTDASVDPLAHRVEEVIVDDTSTPDGAFDSLLSAVGQLAGDGTPVYHTVRRLLEAENPKAELDRVFEEWKQQYAAQPQQDPSGVPAGHVVGSPTE